MRVILLVHCGGVITHGQVRLQHSFVNVIAK